MKKIFVLLAILVLVGCSKQEEKPLPPLKKIELPEGLVGLYSGRLPCDNCKVRMVKMNLGEDSSALVYETIVLADTVMHTDTLTGTFSADSNKVVVNLSKNNAKWSFNRGSFGNLEYLTSAGTVYEDQDGMKADLVRIYAKPVVKKDSSNAEKDTANAL